MWQIFKDGVDLDSMGCVLAMRRGIPFENAKLLFDFNAIRYIRDGPIIDVKLATSRYVRNHIKYISPPPPIEARLNLQRKNVFFNLPGVMTSDQLLRPNSIDKSSFSLNVLEKHNSDVIARNEEKEHEMDPSHPPSLLEREVELEDEEKAVFDDKRSSGGSTGSRDRKSGLNATAQEFKMPSLNTNAPSFTPSIAANLQQQRRETLNTLDAELRYFSATTAGLKPARGGHGGSSNQLLSRPNANQQPLRSQLIPSPANMPSLQHSSSWHAANRNPTAPSTQQMAQQTAQQTAAQMTKPPRLRNAVNLPHSTAQPPQQWIPQTRTLPDVRAPPSGLRQQRSQSASWLHQQPVQPIQSMQSTQSTHSLHSAQRGSLQTMTSTQHTQQSPALNVQTVKLPNSNLVTSSVTKKLPQSAVSANTFVPRSQSSLKPTAAPFQSANTQHPMQLQLNQQLFQPAFNGRAQPRASSLIQQRSQSLSMISTHGHASQLQQGTKQPVGAQFDSIPPLRPPQSRPTSFSANQMSYHHPQRTADRVQSMVSNRMQSHGSKQWDAPRKHGVQQPVHNNLSGNQIPLLSGALPSTSGVVGGGSSAMRDFGGNAVLNRINSQHQLEAQHQRNQMLRMQAAQQQRMHSQQLPQNQLASNNVLRASAAEFAMDSQSAGASRATSLNAAQDIEAWDVPLESNGLNPTASSFVPIVKKQ